MENPREIQGNQSLTIIESIDIGSIQEIMKKISKLQAAVQGTLKKDHDYGIIPGTAKPTLLKPGAEKLLMMFGLTSEYEIIDRLEDYEKGFFAYTLKCILRKNREKITEGVGHCNIMEGKYRYRWISEKNLPMDVSKENLPQRTKEGKYGTYIEYKIENDDPYTLANTILKMAKKRAQIDAVLTVASLSEVFTQDMEDIAEFIEQESVESFIDKDPKNRKVNFGKYKGKTLGELLKTDRSYIEWLGQKSMDPEMKRVCEEILLEDQQDKEIEMNDHPF